MESFIIRPAQLHDREGIDAMLARSYPPLLAPGYDPELLAVALPAMTRAQPKLLECPTWFVAVDESGEVVGCGGWTRERPGTGAVEAGLGHVRHFGTDIDHLRRGIARAIAMAMLDSARAGGIEQLECYSTLVAEHFYASLGFRTIETITVPMPHGERHGEFVQFPAVLMRCPIA
ncbi:MAG TPA: GNAT family N-acetyltransferase [Enhygromyxa sp.]|nr:GNAT family N-acetyltransferase [Enhygromyxa sp.]